MPNKQASGDGVKEKLNKTTQERNLKRELILICHLLTVV